MGARRPGAETAPAATGVSGSRACRPAGDFPDSGRASPYAERVDTLRRALAITLPLRFRDLRTAFGMFGVRGWAAALAGGLATLFVIGAVAALFDNPIFGRQLAARPQDYVIWVITAVLGGLIVGTFALTPDWSDEGKAASGGFLTTLAVGCPICNKVAVALLGTSGALNLFGPSQIFIGIGSLLLLTWTLLIRARAVVACPLDQGARSDQADARRLPDEA